MAEQVGRQPLHRTQGKGGLSHDLHHLPQRPRSPRPVKTGFADAAEALAYAEANLAPSYTEEDPDHPGCFDLFSAATGDVLCIEPTRAA